MVGVGRGWTGGAFVAGCGAGGAAAFRLAGVWGGDAAGSGRWPVAAGAAAVEAGGGARVGRAAGTSNGFASADVGCDAFAGAGTGGEWRLWACGAESTARLASALTVIEASGPARPPAGPSAAAGVAGVGRPWRAVAGGGAVGGGAVAVGDVTCRSAA